MVIGAWTCDAGGNMLHKFIKHGRWEAHVVCEDGRVVDEFKEEVFRALYMLISAQLRKLVW